MKGPRIGPREAAVKLMLKWMEVVLVQRAGVRMTSD